MRPGLTVSVGSFLRGGGTQVNVRATAGHTRGGVCCLRKDCIFTGDTLFVCSSGRTGFPGGSSKEIVQSLKRLATLEDSLKVYPGHDRTSTIAFENANTPFRK